MTQAADWADRRKAIDPTVFKCKDYVMNVQCDASVGGQGSGSVTIDNTPFVLDMVTHGLYALENDGQDGNYTLQFRDDQTVYNSMPGMSQQLYGSVFKGNDPILPPLRMFFKGSSTLIMDIVNYTDRTAEADFFTVQIVFKGFERWDSPRT